jgi:endonuclease/exonuclease/phosphatase (EEP) superfamily protein YafD
MVAALLIILTIAGFLGATWWVFDLAANLRVQLALLLVPLAVVLAATGARWVAATAALAAIVNAALVVPFLLTSSPAPGTSGGETLQVTFLNVKVAGADVSELIDYLRERDDDLVILAAATLDSIEAMEASGLGLHVVMGGHLVPLLELVVLARVPDTEVRVRQRTDDARSMVVEVLPELDGRAIRVLGTHAISPLTPGRARERDEQLAWLSDEIADIDDPVLVMGDLNATPWSSHFHDLLDTAGLIDSQRVHGLQPSWPAALGPLGLPIDHALHSPGLTVLERDLGPSFGSDHRAVHVRLARNAEARTER